jgi:hypothetical protein
MARVHQEISLVASFNVIQGKINILNNNGHLNGGRCQSKCYKQMIEIYN